MQNQVTKNLFRKNKLWSHVHFVTAEPHLNPCLETNQGQLTISYSNSDSLEIDFRMPKFQLQLSEIGAATQIPIQWDLGDYTGLKISNFPLSFLLKKTVGDTQIKPFSLNFSPFYMTARGSKN